MHVSVCVRQVCLIFHVKRKERESGRQGGEEEKHNK